MNPFKAPLEKLVNRGFDLLQDDSLLTTEDIFNLGRFVEQLHALRRIADNYIACLTHHNWHDNVFTTLQHLILNECNSPHSVRDGTCYWFPAGIMEPTNLSLKFDGNGLPSFELNQMEVTAEVAMAMLRTYPKDLVSPADLNTLLIETRRLK